MIQNTTLGPREKYEVPLNCFNGYIKNSSGSPVDIYISGNSASRYTDTLAPNTVIHLTNAEYSQIINLSDAYSLDIVYCSAGEKIEFLNGQVQIGNATLNVGGNLDVTGSVDIGTMPDVTFTNSTIDVGTINEITNGVPLKQVANSNSGLTGTISSTGTAQQITSTSKAVLHFQFRNTGSNNMSIGSSTVQATLLFPSSMFIFDCTPTETTDLSTWYVSGTSGDGYSVNQQV